MKKRHIVGKRPASRRSRKHVAARASEFNRLNALAHSIRTSKTGTPQERLARSYEVEKRANAIWEETQRDVRKGTKRRLSPFDSRSES